MAIDATSLLIFSSIISFVVGFLGSFLIAVLITGRRGSKGGGEKIDRDFRKLIGHDLGNEILEFIEKHNIQTTGHEMYLTEFMQYWRDTQGQLSKVKSVSAAKEAVRDFRKKVETMVVIGMNSHGEISQIIYNLGMKWINSIEFGN